MRIIKRRIGSRIYFYLQHSSRKGDKVITREKYLGKKIPKDIEKIKEEFESELQQDIYKILEGIKRQFQAKWKRLPKSAQEKQKEEIAISFTYNTNAIEGSTITLQEVREIVHDKISPNKPLYDIKETEAHSKIFLQMLEKQEKIVPSLLLRWHGEIFGETKPDIAGKFRTYFVTIAGHIPPDWREVKSSIAKLISFINKSKMNPVELAARSHYRFEKIHPFGDGNGRIGRLLMNRILWHSKYPMLIVEYKKRRSYYKTLKKDEDRFWQYFLRRYLAAHKKRIK